MVAWYYWVLLSAVTVALVNIVRKHVLNHEHSMEQLAAESPFRLLVLLFLIPWVGMPSGNMLLLIALSSGVLYLSMLYKNKAYRHMPISVIAPLQNLSPVVLLIFAFVFLGETLNGWQLAGILLIVIGGYAINLKSGDPLGPWQALKGHSQTKTVVLLLILLSAIATLNRWMLNDLAMDVVTYFFWMQFMARIIALGLHFELYHFKGILKDIKKGWFWLLAMAVLATADILLFFKGIAQPAALIALAIPLRRTAALIEIMLGGSIYKEKGLLRKATGCFVMLLGVLLIV